MITIGTASAFFSDEQIHRTSGIVRFHLPIVLAHIYLQRSAAIVHLNERNRKNNFVNGEQTHSLVSATKAVFRFCIPFELPSTRRIPVLIDAMNVRKLVATQVADTMCKRTI